MKHWRNRKGGEAKGNEMKVNYSSSWGDRKGLSEKPRGEGESSE